MPPAGQKNEVWSDAHCEHLASIMKVLGDPIRLRMISLLVAHPEGLRTRDFPPLVGIAQPTVTHHLQILIAAGFVVRWARRSPVTLVLHGWSEILDALAELSVKPKRG